MSARILFIDLETAPALGYVWGKYDQNVIAFKDHWYLLCFGYKWYGQDEVYVHSLPDYPDYKPGVVNDRKLTVDLWHRFDEADIVVAHNGDNFDIKSANTRFAVHDLPPPSPYKTVDTLKIARKHFKFESNKLNDLAQSLEIGKKEKSGGMDTWFGCMSGDPAAWEQMRLYNAGDVQLLAETYDKLRSWHTNHPNVNLYEKGAHLCPSCGSKDVQRRGLYHAKVLSYQRFKCNSCRSWYKGPLIKKSEQ